MPYWGRHRQENVTFCAQTLTLWLQFFQPILCSLTFFRVLRQLVWGKTRHVQRRINNHWTLFKHTICTSLSAFCSIIWGKMYQNAGQNAPKRNAKCTKTQGKMHQNAMQNAPKRRANAIICSAQKSLKSASTDWNSMQKGAKWCFKLRRFGAKCRKIGR